MSEPVPPAIVIAAHNRPAELRRLCQSVLAADIVEGTPLVISIDGGGNHQAQVRAVADQVTWPHGQYTITEHEHLGLVEHFHRCGDLTSTYGSVILLEDDLVVGPAFQRWAVAALDVAGNDERIAGVSLAAPFFDGYQHLPFEPVLDGSDGVYAQVPWYDGMAWTAAMWQGYRRATIDPSTSVHRLLDTLDDDEWFPNALRYLVAAGRTYLLPRHAHATNSGAAGAHFDEATNYFQVPLTLRGPDSWRIHGLDEALAVYDDHLELTPHVVKRLIPELVGYDLAVDLLATRDLNHVSASHVLTTRNTKVAERLWGASMHPLIANLAHNAAGDAIRLAKREDVIDDEASRATARATLTAHANRGQEPSGSDALRHLARSLKGRLTRDR